MYRRTPFIHVVAHRCACLASDAWYALRVFWYTVDTTWWWIGASAIGALSALAIMAYNVGIHGQERRELSCLALNVYFEARGEPRAGQLAVAEVTMNRVASPHYPKTVCEVVFQKNWDPLRKRYVGAFSWTELETNPNPHGLAWWRARSVARDVYYHHYTPALHGALNYHAVYIKPSWARGRHPVARIGQHLFYD